jgi:hypothetical protein
VSKGSRERWDHIRGKEDHRCDNFSLNEMMRNSLVCSRKKIDVTMGPLYL